MSSSSAKSLDFVCSADHAGKRLDVFLSQHCPEWTRSQIKRLILEHRVSVNRKTAKASHILKPEEHIHLEIPEPESTEISPEAIPLDILYEDSDLLVLNKVPEMVVHPAPGAREGTLVHAVLHHCNDLSGVGGKLRPGIVHRLDKGTSGVLLVAKNDFTHHALSSQFQARQVKKTYYAFVWGAPRLREGTIDRPLGRHLKDRKKISSLAARTREAVTHYRVLHSWGPVSYLELSPVTGRTHQLRVHLAETGNPIVGDPRYGKGKRRLASLPPTLQTWVMDRPFQLLHAAQLTLTHPRSREIMSFTAPLREEMKEFETKLNEWKPL